jgi:hypothetical protein
MSFTQSITIGLFATPLVALFSQSVFAFSITPPQPGATDFFYPETEYYVPDGRKWLAKIDPLFGTELPR